MPTYYLFFSNADGTLHWHTLEDRHAIPREGETMLVYEGTLNEARERVLLVDGEVVKTTLTKEEQ